MYLSRWGPIKIEYKVSTSKDGGWGTRNNDDDDESS